MLANPKGIDTTDCPARETRNLTSCSGPAIRPVSVTPTLPVLLHPDVTHAGEGLRLRPFRQGLTNGAEGGGEDGLDLLVTTAPEGGLLLLVAHDSISSISLPMVAAVPQRAWMSAAPAAESRWKSSGSR